MAEDKEPGAEPDIKSIVAMLAPNGPIEKAAKKQSEGLTEMGQAFKTIEKTHNGNRAAVSIIRRLDKMTDEKRADLIRTLEPLLVERGYTLDAIDPIDLASQASQAGAAQQTEEDDDDDADGGGDADTNPLTAAASALTNGGRAKLGIATPSGSTH